MGLADLHMHTIYSYDGTASVPRVLARARQIGLDVIAITDHDEIAGSLKALELAPDYGLEVIPGHGSDHCRRRPAGVEYHRKNSTRPAPARHDPEGL